MVKLTEEILHLCCLHYYFILFIGSIFIWLLSFSPRKVPCVPFIFTGYSIKIWTLISMQFHIWSIPSCFVVLALKNRNKQTHISISAILEEKSPPQQGGREDGQGKHSGRCGQLPLHVSIHTWEAGGRRQAMELQSPCHTQLIHFLQWSSTCLRSPNLPDQHNQLGIKFSNTWV